MTQSERTTTRISVGLADFIAALSENENAATRALMLIGANELGIDPTQVADDLRVTMAARLPPPVYEKLQAMWNQVDHSVLFRETRTLAGTGERQRSARSIRRPVPETVPDGRALAIAGRDMQPGPGKLSELSDPFSCIGFDFDEAPE